LIDRDYYPLEKAAEVLNCSIDDLIHLGSIGTLKVYILTGSFRIKAHSIYSGEFRKLYQDDVGDVFPQTRHVQLMPACLARIEAHQDTDVILEREPIISYDDEQPRQAGYIHYSLEREGCLYPDYEMLMDWLRRGGNIDDITPAPVKVSECRMVVLHDALERFKQAMHHESRSWLIPNPDHPTAEHEWWTPARYFALHHKSLNPGYCIDQLWPLVQADLKEKNIYARGKKNAPPGEAAIKKALGNIPELKKNI